jgi:hypothetical protein
MDILFILAESEFGKESEQRISYIIRDISQRIEILRENISDRSFELILKLIKLVDSSKEGSDFTENKNNKSISKSSKFFYPTESEFFSETVITKSPDTLITVLTFIIGEYSNSQTNLKCLIKRVETLLTFLTQVKAAKENYFIPITNCVIKLLFKIKSNSVNSIDSNTNENNFNFNKNLEILEKLIDYHSNFQDLEILEMNVFLKTLLRFLKENKLKETNTDLSNFFSIQLPPTHDEAQKLVTPPKDVDISICLPLNEEELNVTKRTPHVTDEILISQSDNTNSNRDSSNLLSNNKEIVIDKKVYTPQNY